jgi:hypothetical protein
VTVSISAQNAEETWIAPIETVSESEEGFERVYQGSQILSVWPVQLKPGVTWRGRVSMRVTKADFSTAQNSEEKLPVAATV